MSMSSRRGGRRLSATLAPGNERCANERSLDCSLRSLLFDSLAAEPGALDVTHDEPLSITRRSATCPAPSMDLTGLPQFTVDAIRPGASTGDAFITGRFSHLQGVRNDGGYLYRRPGPSIVGRLSSVATETGETVEFRTPDLEFAPELQPGSVYPWVDHYWQPYHIDMILAGQWQLRTFVSTPAHYFSLGGAIGWQPVGGPLPEGAKDLGVRQGGWDHEHCELCNARISAADEPRGFVDPEGRLLCTACYERFAVPGDVSFAAEA